MVCVRQVYWLAIKNCSVSACCFIPMKGGEEACVVGSSLSCPAILCMCAGLQESGVTLVGDEDGIGNGTATEVGGVCFSVLALCFA